MSPIDVAPVDWQERMEQLEAENKAAWRLQIRQHEQRQRELAKGFKPLLSGSGSPAKDEGARKEKRLSIKEGLHEHESTDAGGIEHMIDKFGETARHAAKAIASDLAGPVPPDAFPMTLVGDRDGRVLVAILPHKEGETFGHKNDPFIRVFSAFRKALKGYGTITGIGS